MADKKRKLPLKDSNNGSNSSSSNNDSSGEEDRISSRPDTLLVEILSLLPIKSAVATSALSHRWRHLFTQLPHLFFDCQLRRRHRNSTNPSEIYLRFKTIVDNFLLKLTSPHIETFNLLIPHPHELRHFCSTSLDSWFSFVSSRNVCKIKVILDLTSRYTPAINLPTCIFEIQSLVELHLVGHGYFHCKLPETSSVSLPNLRKLELSLVHIDPLNRLWALIKSCPVLEILSLQLHDLCEDFEIVDISAQNLKSLIINMSCEAALKYVIDAPMLEHIELDSLTGYYTFVKYPTKLCKARICSWDFCGGRIDFLGRVPQLLQGISNVKSLHVSSALEFFNSLNYMDVDVGSIFSNVTHLSMALRRGKHNYDAQNLIPLCLLTKLKRIEIFNMESNTKDGKLLEYIISNADANVLEQLYLSSVPEGHFLDDLDNDFDEDPRDEYNYRVYQLCREYKLSRKLLEIAKSSLRCEIKYVGNYICVLRDGSRDGLVVKLIDGNRAQYMW